VNKTKEKLILARIQEQKDPQAFSESYDAYADQIFRFILFKVSDEEIAKDLTSDVFLKVWRGLTDDSTASVKHLKAYMYTTARRLVIDHYRIKATRKQESLEHHQNLASDQDILTEVEEKLEQAYILNFVKRLKDSYQEVIILRYVEELSVTEIGKVINKSPVATRVLLHRAQKALRREYEQASTTN